MKDLAQDGARAMRYAAMETLRRLETSTGWSKVKMAEGQFHPGDIPVQADYDSHDAFVNYLEFHPAYPNLDVQNVVGEENLLRGQFRMRPHHRAVLLDPVDGSTQWAMIRTGHCVSAMMLIADAQGSVSVESAIIANPVHTFTLLHNGVSMMPTFGKDEDQLILTSCLDEMLSAPAFGITGFKSKDRGSFRALLRSLPTWDCLTIGGNPVTPYVFAGGLTAAITWRPQYTWDAVGILMACYTDAVVGDLDGNIVKGKEFTSRFNFIGLDRNSKVIPPMIVAKNVDRYGEVVTGIQQARLDFGAKFGTGDE